MQSTPQSLATYQAILATDGLPLSLGIRCPEECLLGIDFLPVTTASLAPLTLLAAETVGQLEAYLAGRLARFDLPLQTGGTSFQRRVWSALQAIPAGRQRTYGELAAMLGSSPRAVGGACRANPLPLVVPCHRVVARTGPGGFAGQRGGEQVALKQWLLAHEKRFFHGP